LPTIVTQALIVLDIRARFARAPERDKLRGLEAQRLCPLEELFVLWVRSRVAAFDVLDAQLVKLERYLYLVLHRERDALHLGTVP
jgi:hypothetical protein